MLFKEPNTENADKLGNIAQFIEYVNDGKDIWIIHEVGGLSLSKHLFDIKGFLNNNI